MATVWKKIFDEKDAACHNCAFKIPCEIHRKRWKKRKNRNKNQAPSIKQHGFYTKPKERISRKKYLKLYHKYMKSRQWFEMRDLILERAMHHCEDCDAQKSLQVHHLTYERLTREWMSDLVALCDDCHHKRHGLPIDQQ